MRAKQIIMLIAVALLGILLGGAAMWWMGRMDGAATRTADEHAHEEDTKSKGHDENDDHDHHEGEEEHGQEQVVRLTEAQLREIGIEVATAGPGKLGAYVRSRALSRGGLPTGGRSVEEKDLPGTGVSRGETRPGRGPDRAACRGAKAPCPGVF
jgi:hypothetical protein